MLGLMEADPADPFIPRQRSLVLTAVLLVPLSPLPSVPSSSVRAAAAAARGWVLGGGMHVHLPPRGLNDGHSTELCCLASCMDTLDDDLDDNIGGLILAA